VNVRDDDARNRGGAPVAVEATTINQDDEPDSPGIPPFVRVDLDIDQVTDRLSLLRPEKNYESSNVRRWFRSVPRSANAYDLGQALRRADETTTSLRPYASGLLALNWCGHLADYVAVIGCCEPSKLRPFEAELLAMNVSAERTHISSPFDALPANHAVLNGHADEWSLRQIVDSRAIRIPQLNLHIEAVRLNQRHDALVIWTLSDELHAIISEGGTRWFEGDGAYGPTDEGRMSGGFAPIRHAFSAAESDMATDVVRGIVVDGIAQWFYMISHVDILRGPLDETHVDAAIKAQEKAMEMLNPDRNGP
jgi:hypothetical protein